MPERRIQSYHIYTHTAWIGLTAISGISANEFRTVKNDIKNVLITLIEIHTLHMLYDI